MRHLNYIFRNLAKSKFVTTINIISLSVGLGAVMLISLYVINEMEYDRFHTDGDHIFRVAIKEYKENKFARESYIYSAPLAHDMHSDLPEIVAYNRISTVHSGYFYLDNEPYKIEDFIYADSTFFEFFSFQLLSGHPDEVLDAPFNVVLTQSLTNRLFGNRNPIGEVILLNNSTPYTITGVAADPPSNSHIQFSLLVSFSTRYKEPGNYMGWNGGHQYIHYVKTSHNTQIASLGSKFEPFMWKYLNSEYASLSLKDELILQPLSKLHLYHNHYSESLRRNLWVFSGIGVLLLAIALINFINLTIADSVRRIKNYSVLKIMGASRLVLTRILFTELSILIIISLVLALSLVTIIGPYFETLINKEININAILHWSQLLKGILLLVLIGSLTCILPVMFFTDIHPVHSLKRRFIPGKSRISGRDGLVVFQFFIAISLIISMLTISQQNKYLQDFDTGYEKDNVMVIPLTTENQQLKANLIKNELGGLDVVEIVSCASEVPNEGFTSNGYILEGSDSPEMIHVVDIDEDFINLMNIEVSAGENFSKEKLTDDDQYLVNETFIKMYGWENPLGRVINRSGKHRVIGVVKDFNFASLHSPIRPLILTNKPWEERYDFMMVRLASGPITTAISQIENKWKEVSQNEPFEFTFLDEAFDQVYRSETSFQKLIFTATLLTILISLAGLFALSLFAIQKRVKEIGIRKVNGAKEIEILTLLNKDFIKWVVIAFLIACPLAYYAMSLWLENFAYRVPINWWNFAIAGILAITIALLTVSWQSWRAATRNPVEALRNE